MVERAGSEPGGLSIASVVRARDRVQFTPFHLVSRNQEIGELTQMDVVLDNLRLQVTHRYWIRLHRLFDRRGLTPVDLATAAALTTEGCSRVSRETLPRRDRPQVGGWSQTSGSTSIRSLLDLTHIGFRKAIANIHGRRVQCTVSRETRSDHLRADLSGANPRYGALVAIRPPTNATALDRSRELRRLQGRPSGRKCFT